VQWGGEGQRDRPSAPLRPCWDRGLRPLVSLGSGSLGLNRHWRHGATLWRFATQTCAQTCAQIDTGDTAPLCGSPVTHSKDLLPSTSPRPQCGGDPRLDAVHFSWAAWRLLGLYRHWTCCQSRSLWPLGGSSLCGSRHSGSRWEHGLEHTALHLAVESNRCVGVDSSWLWFQKTQGTVALSIVGCTSNMLQTSRSVQWVHKTQVCSSALYMHASIPCCVVAPDTRWCFSL
jgi:hypothetical protein